MTEAQYKELIRVKLPSNPKYISVLRATISEVALKMGFSLEEANDLKLALNEACANVIEHAYQWQKNKSMFVYFYLFNDRLEVVVKDFGKKVDPSTIKSRELNDFKDGGLGVFILRNLVDNLEYDTTPKVGTELKFVKMKRGSN